MDNLSKLAKVSWSCMSKSAIDQFTKCVALELAPKQVRVNSWARCDHKRSTSMQVWMNSINSSLRSGKSHVPLADQVKWRKWQLPSWPQMLLPFYYRREPPSRRRLSWHVSMMEPCHHNKSGVGFPKAS
ncbi:uncharacterized protein zgc:101858 [Neoarius graeffei]|uniref:uncharacterized protein zgc:101858 n=1 Tax=Neoarius graeffei TaxID=443677 RepID=UPI00298C8583|nr:uncharacterized protein zgc:101858 [Neoarius graeffei]